MFQDLSTWAEGNVGAVSVESLLLVMHCIREVSAAEIWRYRDRNGGKRERIMGKFSRMGS